MKTSKPSKMKKDATMSNTRVNSKVKQELKNMGVSAQNILDQYIDENLEIKNTEIEVKQKEHDLYGEFKRIVKK